MTTHTAGILLAITTGLCWSVLAIILKYALTFASSGTIVWVRMFFAAVLLIAFYLFYKPKSVQKALSRPSLSIIIAGVLLSINYFSFMYGIEKTTASNAQIMIQLGPLGLLFIGVAYFKEQLTRKQWLGIFIAGLGYMLFNWDQIGKIKNYMDGNMWLVLAALTWAGFAAIQKKALQKNWTPQEINIVIYVVAAILLFPKADLAELHNLSTWQWTVLVSLGLNTVIAYGAFAEALQRIPAGLVSLIVTVNPLLTILIVTLMDFYGVSFIPPEPIQWLGYLGAFFVVAGVAIALIKNQPGVLFLKRHVISKQKN